MLLADRLVRTVAPAIAAYVLGGTGAHRSSQISTCITNDGMSRAANTISVVNGTISPSSRTPSPTRSRAARNWRFS